MKYFFFGDIHGNQLALKAVLDYSKAISVDRIYCLGDLVGYFNDVNEVIDLLELYKVQCIKGNHDAYLLEELPLNKNRTYAGSILEAKNRISTKNYQFLTDLPDTLLLQDQNVKIGFCHGDINDDLVSGVFPDNLDAEKYTLDINVFGHTHLQFAIRRNGKLFLNPGSIGLPRNGDFRAHFICFDSNNLTIEEYRIVYDINGLLNSNASFDKAGEKFLHNINFGRSSDLILTGTYDLSNLMLVIKNYFPEVSIISSKFGLILSLHAFSSSTHLIYIAAYETGILEITSTTILFNWEAKEAKNNTLVKNSNIVRDNAGAYIKMTVKYRDNIEEEIVSKLKYAFDIIDKFEIKNVKL